jgi:hypothetical protein
VAVDGGLAVVAGGLATVVGGPAPSGGVLGPASGGVRGLVSVPVPVPTRPG